ncbi:MAG: hypothetical protein U5L75_02950 [Candidatus Campbellbacteria bacterium]|nr:hypothetical protein [Candidatus Campbellbacteria bacterium]
MNKNYLVIGLIILALIVIGVIAARPGEETDLSENGENGDTQTTTEGPSLKVSDQSLVGNEVVVGPIEATEESFVVVYRADEAGELNNIIGSTRVSAGSTRSVAVSLDEEIDNNEMLVAVLHSDTGVAGEFEFSLGGGTDVDAPTTVDGSPVAAPFTVTVEESAEETDSARETRVARQKAKKLQQTKDLRQTYRRRRRRNRYEHRVRGHLGPVIKARGYDPRAFILYIFPVVQCSQWKKHLEKKQKKVKPKSKTLRTLREPRREKTVFLSGKLRKPTLAKKTVIGILCSGP